MDVASLVPEFSAAAETEKAMENLESNPREVVFELKGIGEALFDRRRNLKEQGYSEAREKILAACSHIANVVDNRFAEDFDVSWNFALLLSTLGEERRAFDYIERAIEMRPNDAVVRRKAASVLKNIGAEDPKCMENGLFEAKKACELDPSAKSYKILGHIHFELKAYQEAQNAFVRGTNAPNANEDVPGGYLERRVAETSRRYLKDLDTALKYAVKAHTMAPHKRRNVQELAHTYLDCGMIHDAIPYLMYAHALKPNLRLTLFKLVDALKQTEQYDSALEYAGKLETHANSRDASLRKIIEVHRKRGSVDQGVVDLTRGAIKEFPEDLGLCEEAGRLFYEQKRYREAIPLLENLITAKVKNSERLSGMIRICRQETEQTHGGIALKR